MTKTETKRTVLLKHHLNALKVPRMLAEAEKIAQRCAADNADHLAFLLQFVERELIERERKAAERRLKAARFPATKLLGEFDFTARSSVNKPQVLELVKGEYLDRRENILDELGYVPTSKAGAELLFDVIATAYEGNSLIVTTNLPFENWTEVLGSGRLTAASLERLVHRCHILETKGESYRLQEAKRRRRRQD